MAFSFAMAYHPAYQKRYGKCYICHQGIEAGSQIMIGTGWFNHRLIKVHDHYQCWIDEVPERARNLFFANDYVPRGKSTEIRTELNRLRAKRYYIQNKYGGEPNEIAEKVKVVERQIALVKAK